MLGGEHTKKICDGFNTPIMKEQNLSGEDKQAIVLADPKFGMFSLFKYHIRRGYLNQELKKSNKVFCSHIFSLASFKKITPIKDPSGKTSPFKVGSDAPVAPFPSPLLIVALASAVV